MKRTIMVLFFGMLAIALFSCPVIASVSVNFCEYYPLSVGNKWTYVDDSAMLYYTEIKGTEIINGELTFQETQKDKDDYNNRICEADKIKEVGQNGVAWDPPRYWDGIDITTAEVQILYSIEPQVVTPAGTFTDVIKISYFGINDTNGQFALSRMEYLAKGVGVVKDVNYWKDDPVNPGSYTNTFSLQSFNLVDNWVTIQGTVTHNGTPLCAMVLANGQYMFSCGENQGIYELDVPLDANGEITLFAFVDGLAPFKVTSEPSSLPSNIEMQLASPDSKTPTVTSTAAGSIDYPGWIDIAGSVSLEGTPLCAMVLVNGQYMFSCDPDGEYQLTVPLDPNGEVTLFTFVDGLQPYKQTLIP